MGKLTKAIGVAGAVAGAAYLYKSENRKKTKLQLKKAINKLGPQYVKDWGKPSELSEADMVDEGAMTSVQYYNELQQESKDEKK